MDRYNGASLTISELRDRFFVLSEEALAELRAGDTVTLKDVQFQGRYPVPQNANVNSSLLFSVISLEAAKQLGEQCYEEDGEHHILWSDLADAQLATPTYTEWANNLLPSTKIPMEEQSVDLVLQMQETSGGEEILDVVDFRVREEDSAFDASHRISTPKSISAEDQEDSGEDSDDEEATDEVESPSEEQPAA